MITPTSTIQIHPRGAAEKEGFKHFDAVTAMQKKNKDSKAVAPEDSTASKTTAKARKPVKKGTKEKKKK